MLASASFPAEAVRDELASACGGLWQCTVGADGMYGYGLRPAEKSFLAVSYGDLSVVVFQAHGVL